MIVLVIKVRISCNQQYMDRCYLDCWVAATFDYMDDLVTLES